MIGWPSDIENWKVEDLKTFYRTYYAPNNATMFIVGDVEPAALIKRIEHHFGKIPRQPAPRAVTTVEPEQQGERRLVVHKDAQVSMLGPVSTIVLSVWLLAEPMGLWQSAGTALVLAGVLLVGRGAGRGR